MVANLTYEMIVAGAKLIDRLDESGFAPDVALWLYYPEKDMWKLLLVEAKLMRRGPKAAYAQVRNVLDRYAEELSSLSLQDLVLEKPDAPIPQLVRKVLRTVRNVSGIRLRNNVVNGTVIEDAYIYRAA